MTSVAETAQGSSTGEDDELLGDAPQMRTMLDKIAKVARTMVPVVIRGESGTGKELVARAVHRQSAVEGPLVAVNCAAIPESLQDSELFGHERGAFTGAHCRRAGRFEQANGGTLFLDEVAELSPQLQAKLLRVLQEQSFQRVGGNESIHSRFRLVVASHASLEQLVRDGAFRRDLYFRMAVFRIDVPPLRERNGDIPALVHGLLARSRSDHPQPPRGVSAEAMACLQEYSWPGNVRELDNVLRHAAVIAQSRLIQRLDLPSEIQGVADASTGEWPVLGTRIANGSSLRLDDLERWAIETCLASTHGNIAEAARRLGVAKTTLYRKLRRYGPEVLDDSGIPI